MLAHWYTVAYATWNEVNRTRLTLLILWWSSLDVYTCCFIIWYNVGLDTKREGSEVDRTPQFSMNTQNNVFMFKYVRYVHFWTGWRPIGRMVNFWTPGEFLQFLPNRHSLKQGKKSLAVLINFTLRLILKNNCLSLGQQMTRRWPDRSGGAFGGVL